jgi:AraC-like DNA-binding protein
MASSLWYVVIPFFIYATFPDTKIIQWLPWYSCMALSAVGLGLALRYFLHNNVPLTFSSYELIQTVLFTDIVNITAIFLFTVCNLYYINHLYRLKMNDLESLLELKNKENIQSSLDINYNEQYKFGKIYERIVDYMENTQPYLNSKFRIGSISSDLDVNILYVEKAISLHKDTNFSNFINSYRIAHAKKLIHENPQYTLEYIYLSSGFQNQSSFNRIFKVLEGITPSEYRNSLRTGNDIVV